MSMRLAVVVVAALALGAVPGETQQWIQPRCDLKPGHYLVNSGVLYLRNASRTRYADQRDRDLRDAERVLTDAVTSGGQEDNGAAWYYLGRYAVMMNDLEGADSAFTKAAKLEPQCADDIELWRRQVWTPIYNQGVQAYQAGATDSALYYFKRAGNIYAEPNGLSAVATLYATTGQTDSAAHYYGRVAAAASGPDTQMVRLRREAMFNRGAVFNQARRWQESQAAFKAFLTEFPGDVQALAGLASAYAQTGQEEEALTAYRELLTQADAAEPRHLLMAGVAMFNAAPSEPDSTAVAQACQEARRPTGRVTQAQTRRIAAECHTAAGDSMTAYRKAATQYFRGAADAFAAGIRRGGEDRDGLFNLANTYFRLQDSVKMLETAQRLATVDPLNRNVLRLLAAAWQRNGNTDTTLAYLRLADSLLAAEVIVTSFSVSDRGARLLALVTSLRAIPVAPFTLVFDFLNPAGEVVATERVAVPALEPGAMHQIDVQATGAGITVWRYRKE